MGRIVRHHGCGRTGRSGFGNSFGDLRYARRVGWWWQVAYTSADIRRRARQKLTFELSELEGSGLVVEGNVGSEVLIVKGEPGPAERAGSALLSGADGSALKAALRALGYAPEAFLGVACWDASGSGVPAGLLRRAVSVLDPACLIVCDETAAALVREAYAAELADLADLDCAMLTPGSLAHVCGMDAISLGGFEAALADARKKQVMWARLKRIAPEKEPY